MYHLKPQPTGGLLFADPADFSTQVNKIKRIADEIRKMPMPEQIPLSKAKELVTRTLKASRGMTDKAIAMAQDISNFAVANQITSAALAVQRDVGSKITKALIVDIINPAQAAGRTTVPSALFKRNVSSVLMSIAFGYEAIQEIDEAKPFLLRNMPFVLDLIANIGRVAIILGNMVGAFVDGLKDAVNAAASGTQLLLDILKWGSIAGGLYLLYGALKPETK